VLFESDFNTFRSHFENRLGDMLSADELGAFILVLANSLQDEGLYQGLHARLAQSFLSLKRRYQANALQAAEDDRVVFEALVQTGIDRYRPWQQRQLDVWQVAFNPLRGLRPQRASKDAFGSLYREFDEQRFHFDKPFLKPETLCEETFNGQQIRVLYHKFPFVPFHLLMLLNPGAHLPQYMTVDAFQRIWAMSCALTRQIKGFGLAYNSIGASASVNHLHVHGFVQSAHFSIEAPIWKHNGGELSYPVGVATADSVGEVWRQVEKLQDLNQPYNLLLRGSKCYIVPRVPQGAEGLPGWLPDAGWFELSGGFNVVERVSFETRSSQELELALGCFKL